MTPHVRRQVTAASERLPADGADAAGGVVLVRPAQETTDGVQACFAIEASGGVVSMCPIPTDSNSYARRTHQL